MAEKTADFLRQIHPGWLNNGHVDSSAFRPFPKDAGMLSGYDGNAIGPAESFHHYTLEL